MSSNKKKLTQAEIDKRLSEERFNRIFFIKQKLQKTLERYEFGYVPNTNHVSKHADKLAEVFKEKEEGC